LQPAAFMLYNTRKSEQRGHVRTRILDLAIR
jgi:hypothetical protein